MMALAIGGAWRASGGFILVLIEARYCLKINIRNQVVSECTAAQLDQGLANDLPDPLAGHVHCLPDLLQQAGVIVLQTEPQTEDLLFTWAQRAQLFPS